MKSFIDRTIEESSQNIGKCLHCQKCSNGCPISFAMDSYPNQIIRLLQLGQEERVYKSKTIWLCLACETCATRCPMEIDLTRVMATLREMAISKGYESPLPKIKLYHDMFLKSIKYTGRMFESGLFGLYGILAKQPFRDLNIGQKLFFKGKLSLFPSIVWRKKEIKKVFEKIKV
ncbi:MAG: 4Fe-4S dicluster domain-containing protein [bacterium]|nr:4Fe-4S dicluster domain-containing protein [bacterium]